jgi:peptidyl-prolyl cis-trans isomerase C
MRRRSLIAVTTLVVFAATGCDRRTEPVDRAGEQAAASAEFADYYVRQKTGVGGAQVLPGTRANLLAELARLQAAARLGEQGATQDTLGAVELARLEILARSAAAAAEVYAEPTETEIQAAYQAYVQALPAIEFHAQHILVVSEELAVAVIGALDRGAKFADLASQRSEDAESAARGGDLGWIRPGHLPEQFFKSLKALEDGAYTMQPVQTVYGWHVIGRIESRTGSPLLLEQVRAQLIANLQQQRYRRFLDGSGPATETAKP